MSTMDSQPHKNDLKMPERTTRATVARPQRRRLRRWSIRLVTVSVSLVVGLLLAELILRLCGFSDFKGIAYSMPDAELSHVNKPLADVDVRGSDYRYHVHVNSHGFRGDELRPKAGPRFLLIGDSYTFGMGVDDEETFAVHLQRLLNEAGYKGAEVVNAGVYGYGALQAKGLAIRNWDLVNPDVVLFTHCGNDFSDDLRYADGRYARLRNSIPGRRFLRENSALYFVVKPLALSLLSKLGIYNMPLEFEAADEGSLVSDLDDLWQKGRDTTCGALGDLAKLCRERDARFLVTSVGLSATDNGIQLSSDTEAIRNYCADNGIAFSDPRVGFPAQQSEAWFNQTSVGHFTALGNRSFAKALLMEMMREGILDAQSTEKSTH